MKTILIISFSPLSRDPRVRRQIEFLKKTYQIIAVGFDDPKIEGVRFIPCNSFFDSVIDRVKYTVMLKLKKAERYYWYKYEDLYRRLEQENSDLILANDAETLPLAARLSEVKSISFLADMHEFSPGEGEGSRKWEFFFKPFKVYLCSKYLRKAAVVTTVCEGILERYRSGYRVTKGEIITNAPQHIDCNYSITDPNYIKLVHHGVVTSQRKLEITMEMMKYLDHRYHLDLYLVASPENMNYYTKMKEKYRNEKNISFKEPVRYSEINTMLRNYDMGIFILPALNVNSTYALPNKLFEFAQARLAIAIGPSIEMRKYIEKYQCGVISKDFTAQSMAKLLNQLSSDEIDQMKRNAALMAVKECAEDNMKKMERIIKSIT